VEVQRPFLVVRGNLGDEDREHGLADDSGLDERAGVDAHHGGAVVHRVEVILFRLGIDRMRAPERHVVVAGEIDLLPFVEPRGMRTDQDADVLQSRIAAAAHRLNPLLDERGLEDRSAEQRRDDVEDEWAIGPEPHSLAERLIADSRQAVEPLVVALRAGHDDASGGNAVELHGFGALHVVPENHAIRDRAQQRLARQVIPAADRQHRPHAEPPRRREVIELRRADIDERRDQQHVRRLRRDERFEWFRAWNPPLEEAQRAAEAGGPAEPRADPRLGEAHDHARRALARAPAEMRRLLIARVEETEVIETEPEAPRQLRPRARAAARGVHQRHVRVTGRNGFDHPPPAQRLFTICGQRDGVTALGQALDCGLEEPQIRIVPRDEENLQSVTPRRAASLRSLPARRTPPSSRPGSIDRTPACRPA
jgi:hypothetical protein